MIKRAEAIRKAMAALHRAAAARQVRDALNTRNGPNVERAAELPLQSEVLVWREADGWTGPWIVIGNNGHEITINHVNGPRNFRITAVKKYHRDPQAPSSQPHDDSQPNPRRGVFEFIRFDPVAHKGQRLFKARMVREVKGLGPTTRPYEKSRLSKTPLNPESAAGFGMVAMQTDDTLLLASPEFAAAEEREIQKAKLRSKPRSQLSAATPLEFNGCTLLAEKDDLIIQQKGQGQNARGAYIASICQPEATFDYSVAAQVQQPEAPDYKTLNKRIQWQTDNLQRGLRYVPLAFSTAKLMVFTDGSFANNKDLSSQLGFVIVLANEEQSPADFTIRGNVLHWSSTKSKRVTRSVLASEIYGMVQGFDMAIVIATTLQAIVKQLDLPPTPLIVCTDSYSLYECLVKLGTTKEKRLMIDIMALRQSYEQREMAEIRWINGDDNPADAMTKAAPNRALERLIETNRLTIRVEGYVQRPVTADTT
ncbi:polyprotein [Hirsutella rhossiliensis]|uniref:Polyprotein n=1 Tax=Hirsutella rhossiliensis TaxID=111463 RepID=A0A9P8N202_9HYPO|nr:polyprotein [Hirsutella rhossiliensis]KAH0964466.1 polyprotein [Hirsutella rhossiliensis]